MASTHRRRPFAESSPDEKRGDGMWEAYLDAVEDEDKANVESWNGSTTGILTFVRNVFVHQAIPLTDDDW